MPELPEVETVVRDLRPGLLGRTICTLQVGRKNLRRPWSGQWNKKLIGRTVRSISRRGKWILIDLDGPWLLVHLGMTGQFTLVDPDALRQDHTHLVFTLDDQRQLRFRDVRRFGSASFFSDRGLLDQFFEQSQLGPEPFDLSRETWQMSLKTTRRCLKAVLLDQQVVAGVGNIYADESLFEARLRPTLLGFELSALKAERLRQALVTVLTRAIEMRGSSIRDYIGGSGLRGQFQDEFCAYGRTGQPCPRCRTPIVGIRLVGRATHFCPRCQR